MYNENVSDNENASHLAGSLYDMLPADPTTIQPYGQWNTFVIGIKDGKVVQVQNGLKVVEYRLWSRDWDTMMESGKFKDFPGFNEEISK